MPDRFVVGGVYSTESGEGDFGVAKILALDGQAVHVRVYKNKYPTRPSPIDLNSLSLGSIDDPDGFGIGHLPLSQQGFSQWNPVFVIKDEVSKEDLEGYEMWKESGGGVWP